MELPDRSLQALAKRSVQGWAWASQLLVKLQPFGSCEGTNWEQ